jgi:aerobic-type carbon monoxide dehydrogenase small subunit (CoxS/CutS family)
MKNGINHLRDAPMDGKPRGAFCCMGLCQECVVKVDGKLVESCETIATDGLIVQSLRH